MKVNIELPLYNKERCSISVLTPTRIPLDLPRVGRQRQTKSAPPKSRAKFVFDLSCFPVSMISMKFRLWSFTTSEIYRNLARSDKPLLFQKKPFIGKLGFIYDPFPDLMFSRGRF